MYVYRGKHTIAAEEAAKRTAKCGTASGYQKHIKDRTLACQLCLDAHAKAVTAYRRRKGVQATTKAKCGTVSGHQTHRARGQEPCDPCREAINKYNRERRKAPEVRERNREYMRQYRARKKEAA